METNKLTNEEKRIIEKALDQFKLSWLEYNKKIPIAYKTDEVELMLLINDIGEKVWNQ
jgi:hypothetical protein